MTYEAHGTAAMALSQSATKGSMELLDVVGR